MKKDTKAKDMPAMAKYEPPTIIRCSKEHAAGVSVGDKVDVHTSGEVKGVRQSMDSDGDMYEIELKNSKVHSIKGNMADRELRKMTGK